MNDPKKRTLENSEIIPKIIPKKIKTIDFTIQTNIYLPRNASHLSHDLYDASSVSYTLQKGRSTYKPRGSDISYTIQKIIEE